MFKYKRAPTVVSKRHEPVGERTGVEQEYHQDYLTRLSDQRR